MSHIMLDLETWGIRPGCALRSIGAVVFSPHGDSIGSRFYRNVDLDSCLHLGLRQDQGTIDWWNAPERAEARKAFDNGPTFTIWRAMTEFDVWFKKQLGKQIWGHGANFDEPIITAVYDMLGMQPPWKFWDSRCTRTCYEMAGFDSREVPREGTYHNALDDAEYQAICVQRAYAKRRAS
jgi:hypothetical protein